MVSVFFFFSFFSFLFGTLGAVAPRRISKSLPASVISCNQSNFPMELKSAGYCALKEEGTPFCLVTYWRSFGGERKLITSS